MVNLISGRHILCVDDKGNPQKDDMGNFYIFDVIDNKLCVATDCEDLRKFFNIRSDEHPSASSFGTLSTASIDVPGKPIFMQECDDSTVPEKPVSVEVPVKSKSQETVVKWKDENAIKVLIKLWQDHESLFKSSVMKNVEVWRMISEGLRKMNPNWIFNGVQCENKFKDLRRHYMATKDHNAQTGVQPKTCKFYNEMEEVLSMKPNVKPVAIASSLKRRSSVQSGCSTPKSGDISTEACESSDSGEQEIKVHKTEINMKKKQEWNINWRLGYWLIKLRHKKRKKHESNDTRKIWRERKWLLKFMKALCPNFLINFKC